MVDTDGFDFLDLGCSSGGSIAWGESVLGGRGLGIDIDPRKVEKARAAGRSAKVADARNLDYPDGSFRFALFFDMLEHLPDANIALQCLKEAYRVSREFVLIRGPDFDGEETLRELGLKRYYADWTGHAWHHRIADFKKIVRQVQPVNSLVFAHERITDAGSSDLLPISAPPNQGRYNPVEHGPKPISVLPGRFYSRIVVVLVKDPSVSVHALTLLAGGGQVYDTWPDEKAAREIRR